MSYASEFEYANGQQTISLMPNTIGQPAVVNGSTRFIGLVGDSPNPTDCSPFQIDETTSGDDDEARDTRND